VQAERQKLPKRRRRGEVKVWCRKRAACEQVVRVGVLGGAEWWWQRQACGGGRRQAGASPKARMLQRRTAYAAPLACQQAQGRCQ